MCSSVDSLVSSSPVPFYLDTNNGLELIDNNLLCRWLVAWLAPALQYPPCWSINENRTTLVGQPFLRGDLDTEAFRPALE